MPLYPQIKKLWAIMLMAFMALSITPKAVFHDLLADHLDSPACTDTAPSTKHLHKATFQCHYENLVVSVPYMPGAGDPETSQLPTMQTPAVEGRVSSLSWRHLSRISRGPPEV